MTFQEILERVTAHRANRVSTLSDFDVELRRKIDELEWALQALCEKLANHDRV